MKTMTLETARLIAQLLDERRTLKLNINNMQPHAKDGIVFAAARDSINEEIRSILKAHKP